MPSQPSDPPGPPASSSWAKPLLWACLALVLASTLVVSFLRNAHDDRADKLPILAELPGFLLTDQNGREVRLDDLLGQPWVADFIFTRCPGPCPKLTQKLADLGPQLPPGVRRVSFTVDPDHDTPEVLRAYAEKFQAAPDWLFLTGPREAMHELVIAGFKLMVQKASVPDHPDGPILHSLRFVLVDQEGRIRGTYLALDGEQSERLVRDAHALVGR
jgi:protein SCO1/2